MSEALYEVFLWGVFCGFVTGAFIVYLFLMYFYREMERRIKEWEKKNAG
jgi:hypothetical protein